MGSYIDQLQAILSDTEIIDLTHTLETGMPAWPTQARYSSVVFESYDQGDAALHSMIVFSEHTGTHIDAPKHFVKGAAGIDRLPADTVIGRLITIDASHLKPNEVLPAAFIKDFEEKNGKIKEKDIILVRFGWDDKYALQPNSADFLKDWPGLSEEAGQYLAGKKVSAVGTDAMSLDAANVEINVCHNLLLGAGIPIIENVNNLKKLPPVSFAIGLWNKFKDGSGSPIRLLAIVENREKR